MSKVPKTEYRKLRKEYDVLLKKIRETSDPVKRNSLTAEMDILRATLRHMKHGS